MFARFDENPAMTLRVIKETKRYGRTDGRTDGQRENSIPPTNKVCGGYNKKACFAVEGVCTSIPMDIYSTAGGGGGVGNQIFLQRGLEIMIGSLGVSMSRFLYTSAALWICTGVDPIRVQWEICLKIAVLPVLLKSQHPCPNIFPSLLNK